jgi:hypothetical protein
MTDMSGPGSGPGGEPGRPWVKYPFETDGRWVLRYHVPYTVEHDGDPHQIVASIFAEPSVHGRIQISRAGRPLATLDDLTPGSPVEITGDAWRVAAIDYRSRIVLERDGGASVERGEGA